MNEWMVPEELVERGNAGPAAINPAMRAQSIFPTGHSPSPPESCRWNPQSGACPHDRNWPGTEIGATVGVEAIASPFVIRAAYGRYRVDSTRWCGLLRREQLTHSRPEQPQHASLTDERPA